MKKKRVVQIIGFLLLLPIISYIAINVYSYARSRGEIVSLENAEEISSAPDAILVLGAGVRPGGIPSNMLEDRLLTAVELYKKGICDTVIVSGDHGSPDYDEVNVMKEYLIEKGIPSERIFMDHAGFSTYDSLYRARGSKGHFWCRGACDCNSGVSHLSRFDDCFGIGDRGVFGSRADFIQRK